MDSYNSQSNRIAMAGKGEYRLSSQLTTNGEAMAHVPILDTAATKESPNLDLLRSIAVSLVVVSHASPQIFGKGSEQAFNFGTFGRLGVAIFFVHTTLVLMMSLERHGSSALQFLVRRFFRIYPLAIVAVLVVVAGRLLTGTTFTLPEVAVNLLLIQNITGHVSMPDQLWTLPFEVQMYLVLPSLYRFVLARRPLLRASALCAGTLLLGLTLFFTLWHGNNRVVSPFHYIPCFLPGVLAYAIWRRGPGTWSPLVLFNFVGIAVLIAPALVQAGAPEVPTLWALCLMLGILIPNCRQITWKPLKRGSHVVAKYSYGIYLTHVFALWLGYGALGSQPAWVQFAFGLYMLAALPYAAYRFIEKPGIALGARLAARLPILSERENLRATPGS